MILSVPAARQELKLSDRVLMERFFDNLWQYRMCKLEALREVQLWIRLNPTEFYAKFTDEEKAADKQNKGRGLKFPPLSETLNSASTPPLLLGSVRPIGGLAIGIRLNLFNWDRL